jgi:hypothetical protein
MTDMHEFVVPKSMPNTFAIKSFFVFVSSWFPYGTIWNPLSNASAVRKKIVKPMKTKGKTKIKIGTGPLQGVPKAPQWHSETSMAQWGWHTANHITAPNGKTGSWL